MAKFTAQQAALCTFTRCESFKTNNIHDYWVISVVDENGCSYEWQDNDMPGTANEIAIKASAKSTLMTMEMKEVIPIKTVVSNDDILGTSIGE